MKKLMFCIALLLGGLTAAAQVTVTGTVTSANTVTELDGNYSISLQPGQTVEYSYMGFDQQRKKFNATQRYDVKLASTKTLDEVVVIGYGTMKKSDVTGSVCSIAGHHAPGSGSRRDGQFAYGPSRRECRGAHPRCRNRERGIAYICGGRSDHRRHLLPVAQRHSQHRNFERRLGHSHIR